MKFRKPPEAPGRKKSRRSAKLTFAKIWPESSQEISKEAEAKRTGEKYRSWNNEHREGSWVGDLFLRHPRQGDGTTPKPETVSSQPKPSVLYEPATFAYSLTLK